MSSTVSLSNLTGTTAFLGLLLVNGAVSLLGDYGGAAAGSTAGAVTETDIVGLGIVKCYDSFWFAKSLEGLR